uniref:sensor histidine kinase n=1 Tax=Fulvivirga sp. TaxID=1931237 RepID=UPI00404A7F69
MPSMNNPLKINSDDLYENRQVAKYLVLVISVLIGLGSIYYTNVLVEKIKLREQRLISLYAKTLEYFANEDVDLNFNFIFEEIIVANNSIPVIVTDEVGNPIEYKNIERVENVKTEKQKRKILLEELEIMKADHEPILISLKNNLGEGSGNQYVYYKNSFLLTQLKYYPYVQLIILAIFGLVSYMVFNYSKIAEQNRVWVGLAKETAHQLGTPLSSLMAWSEYLKLDAEPKTVELAGELDKDIKRLEMITARFSSIGSVPILKNENIFEAIHEIVTYLQNRLSTRVKFEITAFPHQFLTAQINKPLFDWVIENICKNAVDAMAGVGTISIKVLKANEGELFIDISDTGKGIPKSKISQVFKAGFTTKKRGWGLGLTLVKRIIENYHKGKIFVKSSDAQNGTTFRIVLRS